MPHLQIEDGRAVDGIGRYRARAAVVAEGEYLPLELHLLELGVAQGDQVGPQKRCVLLHRMLQQVDDGALWRLRRVGVRHLLSSGPVVGAQLRQPRKIPVICKFDMLHNIAAQHSKMALRAQYAAR